MPEGLVPRMAIEWGFLILLAVVAAVADLRPAYIILVMAVGWILVVLVELLSWRARPRYLVTEEGPAAAAVPMEAPPLPPPEPPVATAPPLPPVEPLSPAEPLPPDEPVATAAPPASTFQFAPSEPEPAEQTAVRGSGETRPVPEPDDPYAPAPERERLIEAEQRVSYRLEPLKPRPRRKYRFFGPFEEEPEPAGKPGTGEEQ